MSITCKYCGRPKLGGDKGWRKDFKDTGIVCGECLGLTPDTSTPQSSQTCENCRFCRTKRELLEGQPNRWGGDIYNCHRLSITKDGFPRTADYEWCGEWQQKEKTNG